MATFCFSRQDYYTSICQQIKSNGWAPELRQGYTISCRGTGSIQSFTQHTTLPSSNSPKTCYPMVGCVLFSSIKGHWVWEASFFWIHILTTTLPTHPNYHRFGEEGMKEFEYFCGRILSRMRPRETKFRDRKIRDPLSAIFIPADEAFPLMIIYDKHKTVGIRNLI